MALTDLLVKNYRSVRNAWLKLPRVTVIVGANGSGKSNLYRAMHLVSSTASGQLARSIADEGGMSSIIWSGKYGVSDEFKVNLSVKFNELQYDLTLGTLGPDYGIFSNDLQIKRERVYVYRKGVKSRILYRTLGTIEARDASGKTGDYTMRVGSNESILTGLREPHKYPELSKLRQEFLGWRFYHHFRTDKYSPLRKPQLPVATKIMSHDGSDLASAIATIRQWGAWDKFEQSLDEAFPGATLHIDSSSSGLRLKMEFPGLERSLEAAELSDGTLQYLCLLCSVYSLEAPPLMVLNEPETSIHPDLFEPLSRLLVSASAESQIWITTHATELSDYILDLTGYSPLVLEKIEGETRLVGVKLGDHPDDQDDDEEDDEQDKSAQSFLPGAGTDSKPKPKATASQNADQMQINWQADDDPDSAAAAEKLERLRKKLKENNQ